MATEEMKQETEKTETKQSPKIKNLPPLPLPYKTCSLKVSIHCEGCKRKVKKILTNIEGVYRVDIDVKEHKVTVMGIVPPEILLKKLLKAGKNATLLPEIPDPVENKPVDPKEKIKNKKKKKEEEKTEIIDKATSLCSEKPESGKPVAAGKCDSGDGGVTCEPVNDEKKVVPKEKDSAKAASPSPADTPSLADTPSPADTPSLTTEKKAVENGGDVGSGNVGKKKKKKGQKLTTDYNHIGTRARTESHPPVTTTEDQDRPFISHQPLTNNNPPRHDMFPYAPSYYAPHIMYGVSYNVAQSPVNVDGASYYTPPPPYSHAYMHPGYLPYDQNPYSSRPSDSFELFSDENPNGCSIM